MFFVTAKKVSSKLESPHFQMFSAKCRECKIRKRDGYGKSNNGHGKVMDKYFVKYYMGTLMYRSAKIPSREKAGCMAVSVSPKRTLSTHLPPSPSHPPPL